MKNFMHALLRVSNFMSQDKLSLLLKTFIESQFNSYPKYSRSPGSSSLIISHQNCNTELKLASGKFKIFSSKVFCLKGKLETGVRIKRKKAGNSR